MAKSKAEKEALKKAKAAAKAKKTDHPAHVTDDHIDSATKGPVHASEAAAAVDQGEHVSSAMAGPVHEWDGSIRKETDIHNRKK